MLTQDHVVAGVGTMGATEMLATVLSGVLHQAPTVANSEAGLIVLVVGAAYGIAAAWLRRGSAKGAPAAASNATRSESAPTA